MSAATSFLPQYTPAQLEAHRRIQAIRAKQKASMVARLLAQQEAERAAAEAKARQEQAALEAARMADEYREQLAQRRFQAAITLAAARAPESRGHGGLTVAKSKFDDALARVSEVYGIPEEAILSPCRMFDVVVARTHFTVLLAKENPFSSLPSLGRAVGRDHTTVMHAIRRWNHTTGENVRQLGTGNRTGRRVMVFKPVRERVVAEAA